MRRCEICGCTEDRACEGGCSWQMEYYIQKPRRYICDKHSDADIAQASAPGAMTPTVTKNKRRKAIRQ